MQVKRYEVTTMQEAFRAIRKELGPDAILLSSRRLAKGKDTYYEVLAARDDRDEPGDLKAKAAGPGREYGKKGAPAEEGASIQSLWREVRDLKESFNHLLSLMSPQDKNVPVPMGLFHQLISNGVSRTGALCLVETALADTTAKGRKDPGVLMNRLRDAIENKMLPSGRLLPEKRIRAVVGPSGSGKTTTLAKLAARAVFQDKKKVAFLSADTYRLAAAEQLRIFAKIMGVPMEAASTRESMDQSLRKLGHCDIIFVDTPGKSLADKKGIGEIKDLLGGCDDVETAIVLSLTSNRDHYSDAARTYGAFHLGDKVILTKLDECRRPGIAYDIAVETGRPISYVTNGQNVPQDIRETASGFLSDLVLQNRTLRMDEG